MRKRHASHDEGRDIRRAGPHRDRRQAHPGHRPNDALIRVTTTTICGTDVHILKGEYPVEKGLTIGHEPVGVIEKLGANVQGRLMQVIETGRLDLGPW